MHIVRRYEEFEKLHGIRVTNKIIKCKGIYVGNDKEECYNENWRRIHNDMENHLNLGNVEN